MRRLFHRNRKEPADHAVPQPAPSPTTASPATRITPQASAPGTHVCSSLCDGLASLSPEYHESVIAQITQRFGAAPENLSVQHISLNNPRVEPGGWSKVGSELDERRAIERNTELARMPLALPTTYLYPPLPKGHARFLSLAGRGPHPVAFLQSHPVENPPPYIAISYCWDPTSPSRGMFLDNQSVSISETVLEVLNQVMASHAVTGSTELLWIDQICINQDDAAEKLDQVYRMGDIYSKAEKVFVWLGPTADRSDVALENMQTTVLQLVGLNSAVATREELMEGIDAAINQEGGQLYGHLFKRPWFRRLWTVQEALLARNLIVMCGYREVDFSMLAMLAAQVLKYGSLDLIRVPGAFDEDLTNAMVGIINLQLLRQSLAQSPQPELTIDRFRSLVMDSRARQVSMAPDRVYALMGVAPRKVREYMANVGHAQHTLSLWELYAHFAKCMLENDPGWCFLSSAPSKERPPALPSWVPNFDSPQPFASVLTQPSHGFQAGISPETQHLISRTVTTEELVARGFRLDTVSEIIPQTAFTEANQNMKHDAMYSDAPREWELRCIRLCQKVYNLGPEQFPRFHVKTLLAQSSATPSMDGRALDAYHVFWMGCRIRGEALRQVNEAGFPVPEHLRHLPDATDRFADDAVKAWRNGLPAEEYKLLMEFVTTMKAVCSGRPYISTSMGSLGLGCPGIQPGDVICILYGTTVPYVLRPRPDGAMTFVGDAYVYGYMDNEALTSDRRGPDEMIRIR